MKIAIITGGSRGIGAALAKALASDRQNDWHLALLATNKTKLEETAEQCRALRGRGSDDAVMTIVCDVSQREQVFAAVAKVIKNWGKIDLAVANAGISVPTPSYRESFDRLKNLFDINFYGVVHLFDAVLPHMRQAKTGHLAAVSSLAAFDSFSPFHGYCATKAAVNHWVEGIRLENQRSNIKVTSFCPGFVQTDLLQGHVYPMPFKLEAHEAAQFMLRCIHRGRIGVVRFPFALSLLIGMSVLLPGSVRNWIKSKALAKS